jgi:hypothetical protein
VSIDPAIQAARAAADAPAAAFALPASAPAAPAAAAEYAALGLDAATADALAQVAEPRAFTVAGRRFREADYANMTADQELYMQSALDDSGLTALPDLHDDARSVEENARRAVSHVYRSGHAFALLAGCIDELGPDGEPLAFTGRRASVQAAAHREAVADLFAGTREPEARAQLRRVLLVAVAAFFRPAANS